jgi:hypothetical protein
MSDAAIAAKEEVDLERLRASFSLLLSESEGERHSAANAMHRIMHAERIHPDDLIIDIKGQTFTRQARITNRFETDLKRAHRELVVFRKFAPADLVKVAAQAAEVEEYRWPELVAIVEQRKLPKRGWKALVQRILGVSKKTLRAWEQGARPIPDRMLATLRTVSIPAPPPPKPRKPKGADSNSSRPHATI